MIKIFNYAEYTESENIQKSVHITHLAASAEKSGKKTRYKYLPSTTIIFITQDDIFKKDLAKYTFTEQCEEVKGLKLEDGTTKIFLNMTSKNGSKELVSLLQYIKSTDINNPNIQVGDKRLLNLDKIVTQVKESEEWEAVKMDILDIGIQKGMERGIEAGIKALIETCKKFQISKEDARNQIMENFELTEDRAEECIKKYWK